MSNFANQLKSEISRLAKKEARTETQALKKAVSRHRAEIAVLKKRLADLEFQIKKLAKSASLSKSPIQDQDASPSTLRFRPDGFASIRKKLGISAADMGRLLGVSAQSVYHWEAGKTKPRASQLAAVAAVRKMGKRSVAKRLLESDSAAQ